MTVFKGHCPAIVTPFNNEGVNFDVFRKLIDFQIDAGASAIVFLGTTGESSTMSHEEKTNVVQFAVSYVNKRVPVIIGAGSNCTKTAIENSKEYESLGADALLHVTPYYNKATQNGLIAHYTAIANSVEIPIILYNVPGRTGVNILPETAKQLSGVKNIVAIKEASGNIEQIMETIRICPPDFAVYSGDDALTFLIMCLGGAGVISVAGNIVPVAMKKICDDVLIGDIESAKQMQLTLNPLIKTLFSEVNPIPVKKALNLIGYDVGIPRLPLVEMESRNVDILKKHLETAINYI